MSQPGFICPRCHSYVPTGATSCASCAAASQASAPAAKQGGFPVGLCLAVALVFLLISVGSVAVLVGFARARRHRPPAPWNPRPPQARQPALPAISPVPEPVPGGSPLPATRLVDLERREVSLESEMQRGGVVLVYKAGTKEGVSRLPTFVKLIEQARSAGLAAHLVVSEGDWGAVDDDKVPESIRDCVLLDAGGVVMKGLKAHEPVAIVFDREGREAYKGSPDEASAILSSVASQDGE